MDGAPLKRTVPRVMCTVARVMCTVPRVISDRRGAKPDGAGNCDHGSIRDRPCLGNAMPRQLFRMIESKCRKNKVSAGSWRGDDG